MPCILGAAYPIAKVFLRKVVYFFSLHPKGRNKTETFPKCSRARTFKWQLAKGLCQAFDKNDFVSGGSLRKISKLTVPKRPKHLKVLPKSVPEVCETVVNM